MTPILSLAFRSLWNRRDTMGLTIFAIALSVMLVLGVERIRHDAKSSFANTISGTDLIVGARSGSIQLLLYSVFRIGNATNNISWRSYQEIAKRPEVAWAVPLSLGDSHRGFRVMGTTASYFQHYRYGRKQPVEFSVGNPFDDVFDAVLGADVAEALGYKVDDAIVVAHGLGRAGFSKHDDKPFKVSGVLRKTGTPVDRTVHISLAAIEAIHIDWQSGSRIPGMTVDAEAVRKMNLQPRSITAFLVGTKSRFAAFQLQRTINKYPREPLLATLPGIALQELWDLMGTAEAALSAISIFVVASGLLGMLTMLLSSLNERQREIAILRSVGARPVHIFSLLVTEAMFITLVGTILGLALLYVGLLIAQPIIDSQYGLYLSIGLPSLRDVAIIGVVILAGTFMGSLPGYRAYRQSLANGLIVRV